MKYQLSIFALLLAAISPLCAQMASSHTTNLPMQSSGYSRPVGKPVARVNGAVLTDRDLLREMYAMFPYAQQHNGSFPNGIEADIRKGALQMIEFEELVYQEALRRQMTVTPEKMANAQRSFRKQFASQGAYSNYVKNEADGSEKEVRNRIRRSLLIDALLTQEVTNKAAVSVLQAKVYFENNPDKFSIPESFAFQSISILPLQKSTAAQLKDARTRAESALRQAKATKSYQDFGTLAEKISEDDFHVNMGDHKSVASATMPPFVVKSLVAMKPGDVSELFEIDQSFTILRLTAHIPPGTQKFQNVKDTLRKNLQKNKNEQLRADLGKKLRAKVKVEEL